MRVRACVRVRVRMRVCALRVHAGGQVRVRVARGRALPSRVRMIRAAPPLLT